MCELSSFFCCCSSSSSSFLSHVHFQFVTILSGSLSSSAPEALWRSCSCVFAFTLSLYTDNFCDLPCPCPGPCSCHFSPAPARQSLAMLASFWSLFTVDFLHNFAAWLPVSGPRQFCSFWPCAPAAAPVSYVRVCVCAIGMRKICCGQSCLCNLLKAIQMTKSTLQAALRELSCIPCSWS